MDGGGCYGLLLGLLAISSNPVVVAAQDVMQVSGVTTTAAKASMMSAGTCVSFLHPSLDGIGIRLDFYIVPGLI